MDWDDEDNATGDINYYALLNVSKEATADEIKKAYRQLCRDFHPDKHQTDENREVGAQLFNKIQKAYEVLTDANARAVYDIYGVKGLEAGMDVALRTASPYEIREEYERLKRQREEELLQRRTDQRGSVTVNINATSLFEPRLRRQGNILKDIELSGMNVNQSVMAPIGPTNTLTFQAVIATANGNGGGNLSAAYRHDISNRSWAEVDIGAGTGSPYVQVKGFRSLDPHTFMTAALTAQSQSDENRYGATLMLGRQLEARTLGYLTWKVGLENSMNTSIVRSSESTSTTGSLQLGDPKFVSCQCAHKLTKDIKLRAVGHFGADGVSVEYGADRKVSRHNKLGVWLSAGYPSGVVLKVRFSRAQQNFMFPIQLAEVPEAVPVFWGTVVPAVLFWAMSELVIEPYKKREAKRKMERLREENAAVLRERKREAEAAVRLMRDSVEKKIRQEEEGNGLVIVRAWYGALNKHPSEQGDADQPLVIDVTVPLQALVKDSQLHLHPHSKSGLVGFYDCCMGEDKSLRVQYRFRGKLHEVTVADDEPLSCPKRGHLVAN